MAEGGFESAPEGDGETRGREEQGGIGGEKVGRGVEEKKKSGGGGSGVEKKRGV